MQLALVRVTLYWISYTFVRSSLSNLDLGSNGHWLLVCMWLDIFKVVDLGTQDGIVGSNFPPSIDNILEHSSGSCSVPWGRFKQSMTEKPGVVERQVIIKEASDEYRAAPIDSVQTALFHYLGIWHCCESTKGLWCRSIIPEEKEHMIWAGKWARKQCELVETQITLHWMGLNLNQQLRLVTQPSLGMTLTRWQTRQELSRRGATRLFPGGRNPWCRLLRIQKLWQLNSVGQAGRSPSNDHADGIQRIDGSPEVRFCTRQWAHPHTNMQSTKS